METNSAQKITPFLWFDNKAEEAIKFYTSCFSNSEISTLKYWPEASPFPSDTVNMASFSLEGARFYAFDAGPQFKFNPSISFFVTCETDQGINDLWEKLIVGGNAMMPLDKYDWSERYGWLNDRYGVSWQFMKGKLENVGQKIAPLLFFTGAQRGHAEEAMKLYMSIFTNSSVTGVSKYERGEAGPEGMVKHAQFNLMGETFMVMDSGIDDSIPFNEAISLFITCKDQEEVDYYWNKLSDGGSEIECGWVKDKFGVCWQIVPEFLAEKLNYGEPAKVENMMAAMMKMKKLDFKKLEEAYNQ